MRVARRFSRAVSITALVLWALLLAPELRAQGWVGMAESVGEFCVQYLAGKGLDLALFPSFHEQLEGEIAWLIDRIRDSIGKNRAEWTALLGIDREQMVLLDDIQHAEGKPESLKVRQESLLQRLKGIESRIAAIEGRVGQLGSHADQVDSHVGQLDSRVGGLDSRVGQLGSRVGQLGSRMGELGSHVRELDSKVEAIGSRVEDLDSRMARVEEALIRDCLDLRSAPVLGEDGYRVKPSPGGWIEDQFNSKPLQLDVRLLLNSCSADLTRRGLLVQVAMTTHDLRKDLTLYATWKAVSANGYSLGAPQQLDRQELPLGRPSYRVDGKVVEMFFPYDEIPGLGSADRMALALVLTHDGTVLYSLPDQVMTCTFGQRVQCRWRTQP